MITLLLICLFKKFFKGRIAEGRSFLQRTIFLIFAILPPVIQLHGQERISKYNVLHDGESKGWLVANLKAEGNRMHIRIESEVKARIIFRITVKLLEEAIFENGVLVYSALYRHVNGDEKVNQQLHSTGISYKIVSKEKVTNLPAYPINYSMLSLYCYEPVNIDKVYSDIFRQYANIKKVGKNKYQVTLPNGNSNYFTYQNGVCTNVVMKQFYDIELRIKN